MLLIDDDNKPHGAITGESGLYFPAGAQGGLSGIYGNYKNSIKDHYCPK